MLFSSRFCLYAILEIPRVSYPCLFSITRLTKAAWTHGFPPMRRKSLFSFLIWVTFTARVPENLFLFLFKTVNARAISKRLRYPDLRINKKSYNWWTKYKTDQRISVLVSFRLPLFWPTWDSRRSQISKIASPPFSKSVNNGGNHGYPLMLRTVYALISAELESPTYVSTVRDLPTEHF